MPGNTDASHHLHVVAVALSRPRWASCREMVADSGRSIAHHHVLAMVALVQRDIVSAGSRVVADGNSFAFRLRNFSGVGPLGPQLAPVGPNQETYSRTRNSTRAN